MERRAAGRYDVSGRLENTVIFALMLLYRLVRPLARLSLRTFYRKIDMIGVENIPREGAVILAANHPTTFIEPCIMACFQRRELHFLVRGDFFKKPVFAWLLRQLNQLPVYRLKDGGFQNLKQNYATFKANFESLSRRETIMVLAEGRCIHEKRLRPLRKGTARVALGALDHDPNLPEVWVVPVGVNFTYADRARSTVMVRCGEPMRASDYMKAYRENPNAAIGDFTDDLADRLHEHVIHIDNPEDDIMAELLLRLYRSEHPRPELPTVTEEEEQLRAEMQLVNTLNEKSDRLRRELWPELSTYFNRLDTLRIDDAAVAGRYERDRRSTSKLLLGLLPALAVALWHLPVALLAEVMPGSRIRALEFYTPVRWATFTAAYIFYLPLWIIIGFAIDSWQFIVYGLASFLLTHWAIRYFERVSRWLTATRAWHSIPSERQRLKEDRRALLEKMHEYGLMGEKISVKR